MKCGSEKDSHKGGCVTLIQIEKLRQHYETDCVFMTAHAAERFRQCGILAEDVRNAVLTGEIIEQYPEDYPYPSCLVLGYSIDMQYLHVVISDEGSSSRIITAYFPNADKWQNDMRTRKELI